MRTEPIWACVRLRLMPLDLRAALPRVFFDVAMKASSGTALTPLGRIEFELFSHEVPRTAENFRGACASVQTCLLSAAPVAQRPVLGSAAILCAALCTGEKGKARSGAVLDFTGCVFHRIIPGFMAQVCACARLVRHVHAPIRLRVFCRVAISPVGMAREASPFTGRRLQTRA